MRVRLCRCAARGLRPVMAGSYSATFGEWSSGGARPWKREARSLGWFARVTCRTLSGGRRSGCSTSFVAPGTKSSPPKKFARWRKGFRINTAFVLRTPCSSPQPSSGVGNGRGVGRLCASTSASRRRPQQRALSFDNSRLRHAQSSHTLRPVWAPAARIPASSNGNSGGFGYCHPSASCCPHWCTASRRAKRYRCPPQVLLRR